MIQKNTLKILLNSKAQIEVGKVRSIMVLVKSNFHRCEKLAADAVYSNRMRLPLAIPIHSKSSSSSGFPLRIQLTPLRKLFSQIHNSNKSNSCGRLDQKRGLFQLAPFHPHFLNGSHTSIIISF